MNKKLDIVVVSHAGEFDLLRLQAKSIAHFVDPNLINNYIVIWNDDGPTDYVFETLYKDNSDIKDILRVLPRSTFLSETDRYTGWRMQQVLKVLASRVATSEYIYVLDTKNHFIRNVNEFDLFDLGGLPFVSLSDYTGSPFENHLKTCFEYFGFSYSDRFIIDGLPTITPIVQHRKLVIEMTEAIEEKEKKSFQQCFLDMLVFKKSTEFLLYYAYCAAKYNLDDLYVVRKKNFFTLFKSTIDMPETKSAARLRALENDECKSFGLHSGRIGNLRPLEMHIITQTWSRSGLLPFVKLIGLYQRLT